MRSRLSLCVAGLAALLVGLPLAETAAANSDSTSAIVGTSISAALAITEAAISAS